MNVTSNVDVQKLGMVHISYIDNHHNHNHDHQQTDHNHSNPTSTTSSATSPPMIDYEFMRRGLKLPHVMPLRYVATYIVLNTDHQNDPENQHHHPSLWDDLIDFMYLIANPFLRVRTRSIRGKVDVSCVPVIESGICVSTFLRFHWWTSFWSLVPQSICCVIYFCTDYGRQFLRL